MCNKNRLQSDWSQFTLASIGNIQYMFSGGEYIETKWSYWNDSTIWLWSEYDFEFSTKDELFCCQGYISFYNFL